MRVHTVISCPAFSLSLCGPRPTTYREHTTTRHKSRDKGIWRTDTIAARSRYAATGGNFTWREPRPGTAHRLMLRLTACSIELATSASQFARGATHSP